MQLESRSTGTRRNLSFEAAVSNISAYRQVGKPIFNSGNAWETHFCFGMTLPLTSRHCTCRISELTLVVRRACQSMSRSLLPCPLFDLQPNAHFYFVGNFVVTAMSPVRCACETGKVQSLLVGSRSPAVRNARIAMPLRRDGPYIMCFTGRLSRPSHVLHGFY